MVGSSRSSLGVVGAGRLDGSSCSSLGVVGVEQMGGTTRSSLGVVGVGQMRGNEVGVVGGESQRVDVAAMIGEASSADAQPGGNHLDQGNDTEQWWAGRQSTSAPPTNATAQSDQLLRLKGVIPQYTRNVDRFNPSVADVIFILVKLAHDVILNVIRGVRRLSREVSVKEIATAP